MHKSGLLLFLTIVLPVLSVYTQPTNNAYTDSLRNSINRRNIDTTVLEAAMDLYTFYFKNARYDSSLKYSLHALNAGRHLHKKEKMARLLYNTGINYTRLNSYDSAAYYLDESYRRLKKSPDDELLSRLYNAYAVLYNFQSDNATAIKYQLKCIDVLENSHDEKLKPLLPSAYGNIGYLFDLEKQYHKAMLYHQKAYQYRKYIADTSSFVMLYLNLFLASVNTGNIKQAKHYLDTATLFNRRYRNLKMEMYIQKDHGFFYEKIKDSSAALPYYLRAYNLSDSISDHYFKTTIAGYISNIYLSKNDLQNARKYAEIIHSIAIPLKNYADAAIAFELLKTIEQRNGNQKKALQYFELYRVYTDSLGSAEMRKNMLSLESKYQHQKKEKEIANLILANTAKQLTVVKRTRMIIIGALSAALLLLVLGLLYYNSRQKRIIAEKEKNLQHEQIKFLEKQQEAVSLKSMINGQETERARIAKDLHDGLGGLFSAVKMYFSTLQHEHETLKTNDLFEKSYSLVDTASSEIRRIAHNMMPEVLMKLGLVQAVEDLCLNISAGKLLQVNLQVFGMDKRLNASTEIMLYRILQELLNNIIKHSQATEAIVQFNKEGSRLSITVEDNGRGFNMHENNGQPKAGMQTVKSRVDYLNGKLTIDSQKGMGTTVIMDFLVNE